MVSAPKPPTTLEVEEAPPRVKLSAPSPPRRVDALRVPAALTRSAPPPTETTPPRLLPTISVSAPSRSVVVPPTRVPTLTESAPSLERMVELLIKPETERVSARVEFSSETASWTLEEIRRVATTRSAPC